MSLALRPASGDFRGEAYDLTGNASGTYPERGMAVPKPRDV